MNRLAIVWGDALLELGRMPAGSVQCCVTSPPYWGQRDYGIERQIGLEATFEEYLVTIVEAMRMVGRVLRKDGTLWLVLGDSYKLGGKDLLGLPWRVALALQADGWFLRSDIIWSKKNCMPESCDDRPTKSHEYLFLLSKSADYFYDAVAIAEPATTADRPHGSGNIARQPATMRGCPTDHVASHVPWIGTTRNKRSVWTIACVPYPEAHFATFPTDLVKPCILAGTSAKGSCAACGAPWQRIVEVTRSFESGSGRSGRDPSGKGNRDNSERLRNGGETRDVRRGPVVHTQTLGWRATCSCGAAVIPCVVLDPFAGSGTTGVAALELGRRVILIDLNSSYVEMIRARCGNLTPGLALA